MIDHSSLDDKLKEIENLKYQNLLQKINVSIYSIV